MIKFTKRILVLNGIESKGMRYLVIFYFLNMMSEMSPKKSPRSKVFGGHIKKLSSGVVLAFIALVALEGCTDLVANVWIHPFAARSWVILLGFKFSKLTSWMWVLKISFVLRSWQSILKRETDFWDVVILIDQRIRMIRVVWFFWNEADLSPITGTSKNYPTESYSIQDRMNSTLPFGNPPAWSNMLVSQSLSSSSNLTPQKHVTQLGGCFTWCNEPPNN